MRKIALFFCIFLLHQIVTAQIGTVDSTLNSATTIFGNTIDFLQNIRLQSEGKIIATGHTSPDYSSFSVRISTDGTNFGYWTTMGLF
jgi:hypothetical protein